MKKRILMMLILMFVMISGCTGRGDIVYEPVGASSEEPEAETEETEHVKAEAEISEPDPEEDGRRDASGIEKEAVNEDADINRAESELYVDISGQVKHPGVYRLSEGSRIFQAVDAAGGYTDRAEVRCVNQADPLFDGEKIYIYSVEEAEQLGGWMQLSGASTVMQLRTGNTAVSGSAAGGTVTADGKVNLNLADKAELMTLPGVGEAKAEAIISCRETQGAFSTIEDIMKVTGIKEKLFEQIRDKIKV